MKDPLNLVGYPSDTQGEKLKGLSTLKSGTIVLPTAPLRSPSVLPSLQPLRYIADQIEVDTSVPTAAREYLGYGCETPILPYSELNDYGRERQLAEHPIIVMENEHLRATFLPDLGGRLWSLFHKGTDRELLYVNPIFQPTNQAVRNAWFSGGVEWNMSLRGHSPFTCRPLFVSEYQTEDGSPVLRMVEYERVRGVPFVIECSLPPGSEFLFVQIRLLNPHNETIPMYWWSNIAIPESESVRVLVPAQHTYRYAYSGCMTRLQVPMIDGVDASYPARLDVPADYFYDILDSRRPWIAAIDNDGLGLIQTSTKQLSGRKMFVWGQGPGGQRWQKFLTKGEGRYFEIQAGLAPTQYECLPMPPDTEWSWIEAYGALSGNRQIVHNDDWQAATGHIEDLLEKHLPVAELEDRLARQSHLQHIDEQQLLRTASGWGALERQRIQQSGQDVPSLFRLFPDDSLGERERPWLELLLHGKFPSRSPDEPLGGWMVGSFWRERLTAAVENSIGGVDDWFCWLHLGIMAHHAGDIKQARTAWQRSVELCPNAWAHRNLGVIEQIAGFQSPAVFHFTEAHRLQPRNLQIEVEYVEALFQAGKLEMVVSMTENNCHSPRLLLLRAQAQTQQGYLEAATRYLKSEIELSDLREGETTLTDLWKEIQDRQSLSGTTAPEFEILPDGNLVPISPPAHIDFRMTSV